MKRLFGLIAALFNRRNYRPEQHYMRGKRESRDGS